MLEYDTTHELVVAKLSTLYDDRWQCEATLEDERDASVTNIELISTLENNLKTIQSEITRLEKLIEDGIELWEDVAEETISQFWANISNLK